MMKNLRVQKGITQEALAHALEVKQSTISSWEIGRTSPTLEQLVKMGEIFGVTIDCLLGVTKDEGADAQKDKKLRNDLLADEGQSLNDLMQALSKFVSNDEESKLALANCLGNMRATDFLAVTNIVVAVAKNRC